MTEPEPVIHEAAAAPAVEPTANGSNGPPAGSDPPVAAVAPPPAEPVIVSPLNEPAIETAAVSATASASPIISAPAPHKSQEVEALEDRLRRLEAVLTSLADTKQMEERLAERLSKRAEQAAPMAAPATAPFAMAAPEPVATPAKPTEISALPGRRWLPFIRGGPSPSSGPTEDGRSGLRTKWLLLDILREFQTILHMYGDPRYRLTWSGRILPLVFLAAILTSYYWTLPLLWWMPDAIHGIVIKLIDLVPAFCMYKVLTREAQRYRESIPH